jgi:hypothetical protein
MPLAEEWDARHPAIWREQAPPPAVGAINLRHPGYPFVAENTGDSFAELAAIAAAYLARVGELIVEGGLADPAAKFRSSHPGNRLAWLPFDGDPRGSRWIARRTDSPQGIIDRTAVLLAVQCRSGNDAGTRLGSRTGIRVVAHVSGGGGNCRVRITGMTCSTHLVRWSTHLSAAATRLFEVLASEQYAALKGAVKAAVAAALRVDAQEVALDGMRVLSSGLLEIYANLRRSGTAARRFAMSVTARFRIAPGNPVDGLEMVSIEKRALVAHAQMHARLFPQDPASAAGIGSIVAARPSRSAAALEKFRSDVALDGLADDGAGCSLLTDADHGEVVVCQSRLVDKAADETRPQRSCPGTIAHARTDQFAAASAYRHGCGVFRTMRSYGLSPEELLRFAAGPLIVRYRAAIRPGPGKDGRTVNAQVDFDPPRCDHDAPWDGSAQPIQVRLALADLRRSASRREPLGIAADPRWMWHEFGHVLLAGATGRLELYFAHSVGDALAAIAADPDSRLGDAPSERGMRGLTYPWVYLGRRHDREVGLGWSWCGTRHRQALFRPLAQCAHKGYDSEQILSSSLFRLYRALGGDAVKRNGRRDAAERRRAADYTLYLVMRAVASLGAESAAPIETPDQLVSALTDADIATHPASSGPLKGRAGGWAHKVIRWAFEAQGLYASADPAAVVNAPGEPPDGDLYIDDGRPDSEGQHPRGGYMPVSLDWNAAPQPPAWHASAAALQILPDGEVVVEVCNRGANPTNAAVSVWCIEWGGGPNPPDWDPARWSRLHAPANAAQTIAGRGKASFGPYTGLPDRKTRYLVLAEANGPKDPSNINPATGLPCAAAGTPITDLVAGDNNLGLRLLDKR